MVNVGNFATQVLTAWTWIIAWATLVLLTNLWTVGLTGVVYWYGFHVSYGACAGANHCGTRRYHWEVVRVVGRRQAAYRVMLMFLIESGALYCITWVRSSCIVSCRPNVVLSQTIIIVLLVLRNSGTHVISGLASQFTVCPIPFGY